MKLVKLYESVLIEGKLQACIAKGGNALKTCISKYPEVLEPNGAVYKASLMSLSDLLGQYYDISDDVKTGGVFDFTYKSKTPIQSWTRDKDNAEEVTEVSPFLLQTIRKYKQVKDNPDALNRFVSELIGDLDNITVPIVIKLDANSDDLMFNSAHLMSSNGEYEDELLRVNDRATRVTAEIIEPLFKSVFEVLKAIKQHEARLHQQG